MPRNRNRPSRFSSKWRKYSAARRIQRAYRSRRGTKKITKVVKKVLRKQEEVLHMDLNYVGSQGASYQILPWGTDSDLARGNIAGTIVPINKLDRIINLTQSPALLDPVRKGDSIFLKHVMCYIRLRCPEFIPPVIPATTIVGNQGPAMMAKVRFVVVWDTQGEQSLPLASTNVGVLAEIYEDLGVVASRRHLPQFKGYRSNKRWKILLTKEVTLNSQKQPYLDVPLRIKVNKKVHYVEGTDTALQGLYVFAMSDYPATTATHVLNGPTMMNYNFRYYYSDL